MNFEPGFNYEDHEHLIKMSTERIEVAYLKAVRKCIEQPVVFLLNLMDPFAQEITQKIDREAALKEMLSKADGVAYIPTCTLYVPTEAAPKFLPTDDKETMPVLQNWATFAPTGTFPLIVVGVRVITLVIFPIPEL